MKLKMPYHYFKVYNKMILRTIFIVIVGSSKLLSQPISEQFPLKETAPLPKVVTESYKELAKARIAEMDKTSVSKGEIEFQENVNYALSNLFRSGEVYFNSDLNEYLQEISDYLLRENPIKLKIKVFATRLYDVNARSIGEGTLMFDIGLLAKVENEAQLAFIVGHEITHYIKNHSFESFKSQKQLQEDVTRSGERMAERIKKNMKYSRDSEFEADQYGLKLLGNSDYSVHESIKALKLLELAETDLYSDSLDYLSIFNSTEMPLDSLFGIIYKQKKYTYKKGEKKKAQKTYVNQKVKPEDETSEEAITSKEKNEDVDMFATHPDIKDRIKTIENIKNSPEFKGNKLFILGEDRFMKIRRIARIELVNSLFQSGYYSRALYESLQLLQIEPNNSFLAGTSVKSLYYLSKMVFYKERNYALTSSRKVGQRAYEPLYHMINKLKPLQLLKVSIAYTDKLTYQFPENDDLIIYKAKMTELNDPKQALSIYNEYIEKFPNGDHFVFATFKLKKK